MNLLTFFTEKIQMEIPNSSQTPPLPLPPESDQDGFFILQKWSFLSTFNMPLNACPDLKSGSNDKLFVVFKHKVLFWTWHKLSFPSLQGITFDSFMLPFGCFERISFFLSLFHIFSLVFFDLLESWQNLTMPSSACWWLLKPLTGKIGNRFWRS